MSYPKVPVNVEQLRLRWQRLHRTWWASHYFGGAIGVVAGTFAATPVGSAWYFGALAALGAGFVTAFTPDQKAKRYHRAFHDLDQACLELSLGQIDEASFTKRVGNARSTSLGTDDPRKPEI